MKTSKIINSLSDYNNIVQDIDVLYNYITQWKGFDVLPKPTFEVRDVCIKGGKIVHTLGTFITNNHIIIYSKMVDIYNTYKDTLVHEFAHYIAWNVHNDLSHGKNFKYYCKLLGATPKAKKVSSIEETENRIKVLTDYAEKNNMKYKIKKKIKQDYKKVLEYNFKKGKPIKRFYRVCKIVDNDKFILDYVSVKTFNVILKTNFKDHLNDGVIFEQVLWNEYYKTYKDSITYTKENTLF